MSMLRAFIAIELPGGLQNAIYQIIKCLQATAGKSAVRWVPAANIHLTLKFLGDVTPASVGLIEEALKAEAGLHNGFKIDVGRLGVYPNLKSPHVIWLGVDAPPELASLQRGIDNSTARLGYASETRAFSPHLTLGRVRENASPTNLVSLTTAIKEVKFNYSGVIFVDAVHLFKSDLQPTGSVYTRLYSAHLSIQEEKE